ncbi:uncharacterized protein BYT42DRAFT_558996 [Radiomyces spectabilis]|uniref:uncharacterized protein n=1 Tax=Radiomyces spectabilis TaxID=64574 RepID=UPI00221FC13F|nr:uncharacterized protein BYT42DRAFT_558996 [Radiomyces spectabilis]KAI8388114.1 hypothetical protein BYT42DRAFT_558996 [Radiomyces spectabilis]
MKLLRFYTMTNTLFPICEWATFSMSMVKELITSGRCLAEITGPNIVLETVISCQTYVANKPAEKNIVEKEV